MLLFLSVGEINKINRILITNRGEIAKRIIRTAKKMNIETIAIYSDLDKDDLFVRNADISVPLKGETAIDTYLNVEKIIKIAKEQKVDAIHAGYGFLSENVEFVKELEKNGIRYIGPSSSSMEMLSDKFKAKSIAKKVGVPVIEGSDHIIENEEDAKKEAKKIGYPVMLKAIAGGGGKGIRIINDESEIGEQFKKATYEGKTMYKNDKLILEKYIEHPRHIEIQVVADKYGNVVCLGDRECSIQRFNQKIIEEAPSSFLDDETREKMYNCAIKLFTESKYYSVGTVEFIVDKDKNFYFLEVNTRIQVEHQTTEFITNTDLVEIMINIEEGKKLNFSQKDVKLRGHSIECRICAENPSKNFLPSHGRIIHYIEPEYTENVKVESSVELGSYVSQYYDSMIAKLIVYGNTRHDAIEEMKLALGQYEINGIETNITFLESIFRQENFINGNTTTDFIKLNYPNGFNVLPLTDDVKKTFVSSAVVLYIKELMFEFGIHKNCFIPRDTDLTDLFVVLDDNTYLVSIVEYNENYLNLKYNSENIQIKFDYQLGDTVFRSSINGINYFTIRLKKDGIGYIMCCSGLTAKASVYKPSTYELLKYMKKTEENKKPQFLLSPITGKITSLNVKENQNIKIGTNLMSISAMKLDNVIISEYKAKIVKIFHNVGDSVVKDEKLIELQYE